MKKGLMFIVMFFSLLGMSLVHAANGASPVGYWKTIDDVTGQPKSILHIFSQGNVLYGQVVKIFPRPGYDQNELCTACKGAKHNQRIVGMVVMEGLRPSSSNSLEWNGGHILDPLNGKTYNCTITLVDQGHRLNVRGFIGFSMFGRTQTWIRAQ
jgi:uncharacterized protein (DUF2147 family)